MIAFKALIKTNMSADVLRSLALFITYSLHKNNPTRPLRVKKSNVQLRRQGTFGTCTPGSSNTNLAPPVMVGGLDSEGFTRQQIGVMVLEMYQELLFEDGNGTGNLKKFARTVTNKVCLYFLVEDLHVFFLGCVPRGTHLVSIRKSTGVGYAASYSARALVTVARYIC